MLGGVAHQLGAVAVGEDQPGVGRKNLERHMRGGGEEQAVTVQAVVGPLLVGTEIRDGGLDLDDPDFPVAAERHQIGAAPRQQRQFGNAGQPQRQQQPLGAARNRERRFRLAPVGRNDGDGAK